MSEQREPGRRSDLARGLSIIAAVLAAIIVAYVLVGTLTEDRGDIVRPNTRSETPNDGPTRVPTNPRPRTQQ